MSVAVLCTHHIVPALVYPHGDSVWNMPSQLYMQAEFIAMCIMLGTSRRLLNYCIQEQIIRQTWMVPSRMREFPKTLSREERVREGRKFRSSKGNCYTKNRCSGVTPGGRSGSFYRTGFLDHLYSACLAFRITKSHWAPSNPVESICHCISGSSRFRAPHPWSSKLVFSCYFVGLGKTFYLWSVFYSATSEFVHT